MKQPLECLRAIYRMANKTRKNNSAHKKCMDSMDKGKKFKNFLEAKTIEAAKKILLENRLRSKPAPTEEQIEEGLRFWRSFQMAPKKRQNQFVADLSNMIQHPDCNEHYIQVHEKSHTLCKDLLKLRSKILRTAKRKNALNLIDTIPELTPEEREKIIEKWSIVRKFNEKSLATAAKPNEFLLKECIKRYQHLNK